MGCNTINDSVLFLIIVRKFIEISIELVEFGSGMLRIVFSATWGLPVLHILFKSVPHIYFK
jgi:hypothetical protein